MEKGGFVYLVTNKKHGTLYIGVTSDLEKRLYEHKNKIIKGFSSRYNLDKLVYCDKFDSIEDAIQAEKYLKGKTRNFKVRLIESINPQWSDLAQDSKR